MKLHVTYCKWKNGSAQEPWDAGGRPTTHAATPPEAASKLFWQQLKCFMMLFLSTHLVLFVANWEAPSRLAAFVNSVASRKNLFCSNLIFAVLQFLLELQHVRIIWGWILPFEADTLITVRLTNQLTLLTNQQTNQSTNCLVVKLSVLKYIELSVRFQISQRQVF
jgi:hypothetical protein